MIIFSPFSFSMLVPNAFLLAISEFLAHFFVFSRRSPQNSSLVRPDYYGAFRVPGRQITLASNPNFDRSKSASTYMSGVKRSSFYKRTLKKNSIILLLFSLEIDQYKLQRFRRATRFFQLLLNVSAVFGVSRVNQDETQGGCYEVTVYATKTDSFYLHKPFLFALCFQAVIKLLYRSSSAD
jgi:hypothetical protein